MHKYMPISIAMLSAFLFVVGNYCSKQPTQPIIVSGKGTLTANVVIDENTLKKEAKTTAITSITDTIYNSQGQIIHSGSIPLSDSARLSIELDAGSNYRIVITAFDNNNAKYRGENTFSITAGQTTPVTIVLQFLISQEKTILSADKDSIQADGLSKCTIKIIPKYVNGNNIGSGLTVSYTPPPAFGALLNGVSYNAADQSYTQELQSSMATGKAIITARVSTKIQTVDVAKKDTVIFYPPANPIIIIKDTSATPGTTIDIPVIITDITNKKIIALSMALRYNKSILRCDTLKTANSMCSNWDLRLNKDYAVDKIKIAGGSATQLSGYGNLFFIRFYVLSNASGANTDISIEEIILEDINGNKVITTTRTGKFTVR